MKNVKHIFLLVIFIISNSISAQDDITIIIANQKIVANDFFFDVFVSAPNNPIYLGNSVLILNFNENVFENLSIVSDPESSTSGGSCTFEPTIASTINKTATRNKYFSNMVAVTVGNEIEIVVSVNQPIDANEFSSTIAKIDNNNFRLATFKVSNLKYPLGLVNLKWKESCISCGKYSEIKTIDPNDFSESVVNITTENQDLIDIEAVLKLELKVFLEGAYSSPKQTTQLTNELPCIQPYSSAPWGYGGSEEVDHQFYIDNNIVDWILVELRDGSTASQATNIIGRRAALVDADGIILDIDGEVGVKFIGVDPGSYYVVIHHRNHLSIIGNTKVEWLP